MIFYITEASSQCPTVNAGSNKTISACDGNVTLDGNLTNGTKVLFTENFEAGTTGWLLDNNFKHVLTPPYVQGETITSGSKFLIKDSEGDNSTNTATATSPVFSTIGYKNITLTSREYFRQANCGTCSSLKVQASLDNSTWTDVWSCTSSGCSTYGTYNNFTLRNYTLPVGFENKTTVYIRFSYTQSDDWYWCIDDISVTGTAIFAWSPPTGLSSTTTLTPTANPASTTIYTLTYAGYGSCSQSQSSVTVTNNTIPAYTGAYGNGEWRIYGWSGGDLTLNGTFRGYYTESSLSYNTTTRWTKTLSPHLASGWQGCTVGTNASSNWNSFATSSRRTGFDCGLYRIRILNHDDNVVLYVNGTEVYKQDAADDGTNANTSKPGVWIGELDAASTVEIRVLEGTGDAYHQVEVTKLSATTPTDNTINVTKTITASTKCTQNGTVTITPNGTDPDPTMVFASTFVDATPQIGSGTASVNASYTAGTLQLTTNSNSQNGSYVITPSVDFNGGFRAEFDLYIGGGNGADGVSLSFGDDANGGGGIGGSGTKLKILFDTYKNGSESCSPQNTSGGNTAVYATYNGTLIGSCTAFAVRGYTRHVELVVTPDNKIYLKVGTTVVLNSVTLPSGYISADKNNWKFAFSAATGGANDIHRIDNLYIFANKIYEYSYDNGGTWTSSNTYSLMGGGTTQNIKIKRKGQNCPITDLGTSNLGTPLVPSITLGTPPEVCFGSTSGSVPYTAQSNATHYWIDFNTAANTAGFTDNGSSGSPVALPASPLTYTLNATTPVANGYSGMVYVRNSTSECVSSGTAIAVNIIPSPTFTSASSGTVCSEEAQSYTPAGSFASYSWTRALMAGISNAAGSSGSAGSGGTSITETLTNTTTTSINVTYVFTLKTDKGCTKVVNYVVTVYPKPNLTSATTNTICSGIVQNYTPTADVASTTYSWTRALVAGISNAAGSSGTAGTGGSPITETLINTTNVSKNVVYVITLKTPDGCSKNFNYTVTIDPTPPTPTVGTMGSGCGALSIIAGLNDMINNTAYFYRDKNGDNIITYGGPSSPDFLGQGTLLTFMEVGTFDIYVTERAPTTCESAPAMINVTITEPFPLSVNTVNPTCYGAINGSATISAPTAGPITSISWSTGQSGAGLNTISGLGHGNYNVTVVNDGGCVSFALFSIVQPAPINITLNTLTTPSCIGNTNGAITINTPTGGSGSYNYTWSNGATTQNISGLAAGTYTVTARSAGVSPVCSGTATYTINNPLPVQIYSNEPTLVTEVLLMQHLLH